MKDNNIIRDAIDCIKILKYEIRELKVENEKLRALCDTYKTYYRAKHNDIDSKLFKYRQTLQEIKRVAETCNSKINCEECPFTDECNTKMEALGVCKIILKLITKAESEG